VVPERKEEIFRIKHQTSQYSMLSLKRIALQPTVSIARRSITITQGVEFDTIAREWRMKWSADNDKKSLAAVQEELTKVTAALKAVDGVKSVQRVVCGGCLDFKVIVALPAEKWGAWVRDSLLFSLLI
jgi:hypothetical protein